MKKVYSIQSLAQNIGQAYSQVWTAVTRLDLGERWGSRKRRVLTEKDKEKVIEWLEADSVNRYMIEKGHIIQ